MKRKITKKKTTKRTTKKVTRRKITRRNPTKFQVRKFYVLDIKKDADREMLKYTFHNSKPRRIILISDIFNSAGIEYVVNYLSGDDIISSQALNELYNIRGPFSSEKEARSYL